ncbi:DUF885 domain-containing protein [bacterium]|nr:DUF885 domain-containing protein [bacterium]
MVLASILSLGGTVHAASPEFSKAVDTFYDKYFEDSPSFATNSGIHKHDSKLEDFSAEGQAKTIGFLEKSLAQFQGLSTEKMTGDQKIDREVLLGFIQSKLFELKTIRNWERNPDLYSSFLSSVAFTLVSRNFSTPAARLKSLVAREKLMPQVLQAGRKNLKNPPEVFTKVALEQLPGTISFYEKEVPAAFASVKDAKLQAEFKKTNAAVIAELKAYGEFLEKELLPKSKGDFRIGAKNYSLKLLYDERVSTPLDQLLEIGKKNIKQNQDEFKALAKKISPDKTPEKVLEDLTKNHTTGDKLLGEVRQSLSGLRNFVLKNKIASIPGDSVLRVEETPPFMRALSMASMDIPGPYEKESKEAFFNVTLPEKDWDQKRIDEHLEGFHRGTLIATAIHEAYPGHFVQFVWKQVPKMTKVRKLVDCGSNSEGWAHYTEQMILDEGYGKGDPALRLGQLQDALLRNARYIVGIQMHTGKMSYDEAIDYFVKEGFQSRANAEREVKRGTSDPTYLVYTLGKLEIFKLREDYQKKLGKAFTLKKFHDEFLGYGTIPLSLIRQGMLGTEGVTI